jgi:MFS family permease
MSGAPPEKTRPARLPRNVFWIGLVSLLNDFSSDMIYPLLPLFFTAALHASPATLGDMEGLVESVSSLLKLWSGRVADRLPGRKPLLVFGYSLASVARPLVAVAAAPWHVIAIRVADRVGKGVRGAPRDALLADSVEPGQRGRAFGFHRAMDHLGATAGPVTALVLIPLLFGPGDLRPGEYRVLFGIAALPALASVLILLFCVREAPRHAEVREAGTPEVRLGRPFWYVLGVITLFTLGNSSDMFLLLRARAAGLKETDILLVWALLHVVKSALSTPAGALSDRIPRRWLIAGGWLVYAGVYVGFGQATAPWHIWALFAVYGIYFGMVEGPERALIADLVPKSARGTAYGWYNAAIGIAAFPASALFGRLWTWVGPQWAFGFGAGLALASAVLLLAAGRPAPAPTA